MPGRGNIDRRICVAPMMDWTDRHCRYFLRLINRRALLYSEMVTTGAILFGDKDRHLAFDPAEHPVALQLGGADPGDLAECARIGEGYGYDEINLNVGCPSDRVQNGRFGACLMGEPDLVAASVAAMAAAVKIPVTVKCRIGIDDRDDYSDLLMFVEYVAAAGCRTFIVHARKAVLQGLSPKQNRDIPPLRYDYVYRLKAERPHLEIIINGGIPDLDAAALHLEHVDGVMFGRAAYQNPYMLAGADDRFFAGAVPPPSRFDVLDELLRYVARKRAEGVPLQRMTRHVLGLFQGQPGARAWRRYLSENAYRAGAGTETLEAAASFVRPANEGAAADNLRAAAR